MPARGSSPPGASAWRCCSRSRTPGARRSLRGWRSRPSARMAVRRARAAGPRRAGARRRRPGGGSAGGLVRLARAAGAGRGAPPGASGRPARRGAGRGAAGLGRPRGGRHRHGPDRGAAPREELARALDGRCARESPHHGGRARARRGGRTAQRSRPGAPGLRRPVFPGPGTSRARRLGHAHDCQRAQRGEDAESAIVTALGVLEQRGWTIAQSVWVPGAHIGDIDVLATGPSGEGYAIDAKGAANCTVQFDEQRRELVLRYDRGASKGLALLAIARRQATVLHARATGRCDPCSAIPARRSPVRHRRRRGRAPAGCAGGVAEDDERTSVVPRAARTLVTPAGSWDSPR